MAFWAGDQLVVGNYVADRYVVVEPAVMAVLDACHDWKSPADIEATLSATPTSIVRRILRLLIRARVIERRSSPGTTATLDGAVDRWAAWHPAALAHFATKSVPWASVQRTRTFLADKALRDPVPPAVKRYPDAPLVPLPSASTAGEFPDTVRARRTWRRFGPGPIDRSALATALSLTIGVQRWEHDRTGARVTFRTSPSGGARHPLEAYVWCRRVTGVEPGLYHYAADAQALERLEGPPAGRRVEDYVPHQWWYNDAAAVLLLTAVFERSQWRYPYARAYRAVLAEAGHVCQTFCLAATWLGLAPFCTMATADTTIERDLGLDGVGESVVYLAGVAERPSGSAWEPLPVPGASDPFARLE